MDDSEIYNEIYVAIGEASGCWDNLSGAGTYQSTRAKNVSDKLHKFVKDKVRKARLEALTDYINLGPNQAKLLLEIISKSKIDDNKI
jgi:hypothetical protein